MKNIFDLKNLTICTILTFAFVVNTAAQTPQYYNFDSNEGSNSFPFNTSVAAGKNVQWLVGPSEYNQPSPAPAGNISKLWFRVSGTTTGAGTYTNLTIKLGQTSQTSLPTGAYYTGQMDTVYFRSSVTISAPANTWVSFVLDRPFAYNPTQSLVIDVQQCGITSGGFSVSQHTMTGFIRRDYSVTGGCPQAYSGQDATLVHNGIDVAPPSCNYTYASQTSGTTSILQSVKAISNLIGWAAGGAGTVRKTTDGGSTWGNANPNPGVINGDIYNIWANDVNNAWCTTSPAATFIYRTTNGGTNWTQVFTQAGGFIDAIQMTNANTGFAYGDPVSARWSLWKTTNAGATWDSAGLYLAQVGSEAGWNNAMWIVGNNIWFGTNNTKVYHSTNFGATGSWVAGTTTGTVNSYGVQFNDANTGLAGGSTTAFVVRSTNGGTSYSSTPSIPAGTGNITGITGTGTDYWALRGNNIHRSSNNGDNWTQGYTGTTALWDVDVVVSGGCAQGWGVGATGTIIKITGTPVAVQNNNNQVPEVYVLNQNYPNPFNPATTIGFALPKSGNVELTVYDVLGREVAVLVNEFRQAGSYSVSFNASQLASGVYVYSIKSGEFTDTKKMVLVK